MSDAKVASLSNRIELTKEMLQKKRAEVPVDVRKADPELRRLKKIIRRVANKKRRMKGASEGTSAKEK